LGQVRTNAGTNYSYAFHCAEYGQVKQDIKNVIFLIHNVTRLPLHVGLGFPRLVVPYLTL
ncbi:hypothetical protein BXA17_20160, partial [Acinetobacter baumannii]